MCLRGISADVVVAGAAADTHSLHKLTFA